MQRDNFGTITTLLGHVIMESFEYLKAQDVLIEGIIWCVNEMLQRKVGIAAT
jgi:hypothetical protein